MCLSRFRSWGLQLVRPGATRRQRHIQGVSIQRRERPVSRRLLQGHLQQRGEVFHRARCIQVKALNPQKYTLFFGIIWFIRPLNVLVNYTCKFWLMSLWLQGAMQGKFACFLCDDLCLTCKGPGEVFCDKCKYYSIKQGSSTDPGRCIRSVCVRAV